MKEIYIICNLISNIVIGLLLLEWYKKRKSTSHPFDIGQMARSIIAHISFLAVSPRSMFVSVILTGMKRLRSAHQGFVMLQPKPGMGIYSVGGRMAVK